MHWTSRGALLVVATLPLFHEASQMPAPCAGGWALPAYEGTLGEEDLGCWYDAEGRLVGSGRAVSTGPVRVPPDGAYLRQERACPKRLACAPELP